MIYITSDHAGFEMKEQIVGWLKKTGRECKDLYPELVQNDDYPESADELAIALKKDPKGIGIALCGSGQGICIALNRHSFIRAVIHDKREIVRLGRSHNDANVLCIPARFTHITKVKSMLKVFLNTPFSKEVRHIKRIEKLSKK
jgi:ribose 5-phosphate isomerase B